jgi:hypothetical protein
MSGLQRIPLIGRKFAKRESGLYVPKADKTPKDRPVPRVVAPKPERAIVTETTERQKVKAKAKRRKEGKRARAARRKNRRQKH